MNNSEFNIVIGAGGYGKVMTSLLNPTVAVKYLYKGGCPSAHIEFLRGKQIYDAVNIFNICTLDKFKTLIKVPKQYDYGTLDTNDSPYSCFVTMERVFPLTGNYLHHVSLSDNLDESLKNKLYGLRGIFASKSLILKLIDGTNLTLRIIVFLIGVLTGIMMFGANINPIDVEYVLIRNDNTISIAVIDFGLVEPIKQLDLASIDVITQSIIYDIYYNPCDEYANDYYSGLKTSANCFEIDENIIDMFIKMFEEKCN